MVQTHLPRVVRLKANYIMSLAAGKVDLFTVLRFGRSDAKSNSRDCECLLRPFSKNCPNCSKKFQTRRQERC
jgi:hypothetical protein